jgi:hypothetical protein
MINTSPGEELPGQAGPAEPSGLARGAAPAASAIPAPSPDQDQNADQAPPAGSSANARRRRRSQLGKWIQPATTVKILRSGVGVIGILLPFALIIGNLIVDGKLSFPSSMSSSYYTHTRNLFVGLLCALGVFLIFYWPTLLQGLFTCFAGICALLVAFDPTAPAPGMGTEPAWINYLHHSAAGALIGTLGLFCWVVFISYSLDAKEEGVGRSKTWWHRAVKSLKPPSRNSVYLICGFLILTSGGFALYTGIWPTGWSTGWSSLYLFEAMAVWAFGVAWITASFDNPLIIQGQAVAATAREYERMYGAQDNRTLAVKTNLRDIRMDLGVIPGPAIPGPSAPETPPAVTPPPLS